MTTRRQFLTSSLATGAATMMPVTMTQMGMASAQGASYRALVCLFFYGALDNFDTIIPYNQSAYNEWATVRDPLLETYTDAAVAGTRERDNLLELTPVNAGDLGGNAYGLAPQMPELARIFNAGDASIVGGVGPLIRATTRQDIDDDIAQLPPKLFSHNDQQSLWQTSSPEGARSGWGGRIADAIYGGTRTIYSTISASSNPTFLVGDLQRSLEIRSPNVSPVAGTGEKYLGSTELAGLLRDHYAQLGIDHSNLFSRDYAAAQAGGVVSANQLSELMGGTTEGESVEIDGNKLSEQFAIVAKMISLRGALGVDKQVFFVSMGGFDTHSDQAGRLPFLQSGFDAAIGSFYDWLVASGISSNVTTFTASDFGRTFKPNASGTDHGWAGHHFVIGGGVNGGRIFGDLVLPVDGRPLDYGRGRLIPSMSVDLYGAEMAKWLGVSEASLPTVFPNYSNFDPNALPLFA